ncbi:hypothetical protein JZ751_009974 [Albula glossodonta]|uniref:Ig-like domain-containing protein n=1 Tax=Albula glossodonta TaxID=121402 RepID=A0A8T2P9T7_9TELE|nr:hypothetical protein JZ751_009974 [Albula glossodonta]
MYTQTAAHSQKTQDLNRARPCCLTFRMPYSIFTAVLLGAFCAFAQVQCHLDNYVIACQTNGDPQDGSELDGDEMDYVDFKNKQVVVTLPDFADKWEFPGHYEAAMGEQQVCKNNLDVAIQAEKNPPEKIDPPQATVYSRNKLVLGQPNTLICLVNNFYPPPVKVKWTRNDIQVKEEVTLSRYYPNDDFTFHQFSTLGITPEEEDIYSCTVEHRGLQEPLTRMWGKILLYIHKRT